jgi:hypothetical protein
VPHGSPGEPAPERFFKYGNPVNEPGSGEAACCAALVVPCGKRRSGVTIRKSPFRETRFVDS